MTWRAPAPQPSTVTKPEAKPPARETTISPQTTEHRRDELNAYGERYFHSQPRNLAWCGRRHSHPNTCCARIVELRGIVTLSRGKASTNSCGPHRLRKSPSGSGYQMSDSRSSAGEPPYLAPDAATGNVRKRVTILADLLCRLFRKACRNCREFADESRFGLMSAIG